MNQVKLKPVASRYKEHGGTSNVTLKSSEGSKPWEKGKSSASKSLSWATKSSPRPPPGVESKSVIKPKSKPKVASHGSNWVKSKVVKSKVGEVADKVPCSEASKKTSRATKPSRSVSTANGATESNQAETRKRLTSTRSRNTKQASSQLGNPSRVLLESAVSKLDNRSLETQVATLVARIDAAGGFPERRRLSLRDNNLVTSMSRAMANDPTLTEIIIESDPRFQHVSKTLLLDFADGMRTNLHIRKIVMTGLELDNGFLSALATSLETNFALEAIDLGNNSFTSDGLVDFCQSITDNTTLRRVNLKGQLSPIMATVGDVVIDALSQNRTLEKFRVSVKSDACKKAIKDILERNNNRGPPKIDRDQKLLVHLEREASRAEAMATQRKLQAKTLGDVGSDDWAYLYELSETANRYKLTQGFESEDGESEASSKADPFQILRGGTSKMIGACVRFTSDGSFLTNDFISSYLVEDKDDGSLTFAFQTQSKLFKRFPIGDSSRKYISEKFADTLLGHPRSKEITHINMANSCCGDEWLTRLCQRCLDDPCLLPQLHLINLETNFISTTGVVALAQCIASPTTWRYLQAIKLENQRHLISSRAELELTKALCVNRSVIRFSLRVRNLWERSHINKFVSRNMDYLRQARLKHAVQTGTHVQRSRNKMEELFDRVAADDPSLTSVEVVGDQLFLSLPRDEVLKAATAFATNKHVKSVRMTMLRLDDEFASILASALEYNCTIEALFLDSNAIASEGIVAIIKALAKNNSIVELQLRHQSKPLGSAEEETIDELLGDNRTITKLGLDLRSLLAKNQLERRLKRNFDMRRQARKSSRASSRTPSFQGSGRMQELFNKIADNDASITQVDITGDRLFLSMCDTDRILAAASFAANIHVTILKLNMADLDDAFALRLAQSLETNTAIEKVILDSNKIGSEGIKALIASLAKNTTVTELQVRHQKKPLDSASEVVLAGLLGDNQSVVKLGVDLRSPQAQREIENKLRRNRDLLRQARVSSNA